MNPIDNEEDKPKGRNNISDILAKTSNLNTTDAGGCTANVGLIKNGVVYLANAGDSRAVAQSRKGETIALSYDHKPENEDERARIENAEGYVENNRVCGNLALSRALGDFSYKLNSKYAREKQQVIPNPDCIVHPASDIEFAVLACDGIWDCVSNEECTAWFAKALHEYDNNTFKYVPKNMDESSKERDTELTDSTTDSSSTGS